MVDKTFYQAAAAEVAGGVVDQALWIKVTADMAGSDKVTRQAKYIQLRAQELAGENLKLRAKSWLPRTKWQWFFYAVGASGAAYVAGIVAQANAADAATSITAFVVVLASALALPLWASRHY